MLIIEHNNTKLKLGRVRIYQLNTFKTFTDAENAIYNDKKKKNTELLEVIHNNESVRTVSDKYLNERNEIAIFENDIVRLALADRGYKKCDYQLLDEIIHMVINHNEILWQIIDKGIIVGGKKYKLFTATTGQVRNCKVTLIKEEFYEAHKSFLMAGLTVDRINADKGNDNKGMNVGKYLSYNALLLSSSKLPPKNIDIDKCIVVDGLKTIVNGKVKYIDIKTDDNGQCYVNDTPKEYQTKRISIEHTDGAGMFIPGELHSSCQIRGGYIKGAMFPFDFRLFAHEISHNSILVDPWGTPHDVEKEDIRYILTTSQLKMWKQYSSWEEYKKKFKENNLKLSINAYAEPPKEEVTFSYQFLQTLPYNTDITELCQPAVEDLRKLKTDLAYVKKELGVTIDDILNEEIVGDNAVAALVADGEKVENANYYIAKALDIYPPLIQDKYIMNKIHSLYNARKNSYMGGKIPVRGYYSYVTPDMYAFCEYLFMGNVNPQGLVPENHVYNKYYGEQGDVEEVLCLRSPHLSRYECPRRKLIVSDECKKWFKYMESDTVVSCHDMISLFLMCDWDGDHILVIADKTVLKATEDLPDVPLYYDMQKAKAQHIDNESIYKTLVDGFKNNIIGLSSNAITKLWNRPDLEDNSDSGSSDDDVSDGVNWIYEEDSYPKDLLDIENSIVDRLKYNSIASSFGARAGYYEQITGDSDYYGTSDQNILLLDYLKSHGLKKGSKSAHGGLTLTDEEGLGSEVIFSKKYGTLRKLDAGDMVFNADQVEKLWNLSKGIATPNMYMDNLGAKLPDIPNISNNLANKVDVSYGDVSLSFPNVHNYEDFMKQAQQDPKFEKMVQNMTLGQTLGRNSLSKLTFR